MGVMSLMMRTLDVAVFGGLEKLTFILWSVGLLHCLVVVDVSGLSAESLVLG
jgi:hypothetical protein